MPQPVTPPLMPPAANPGMMPNAMPGATGAPQLQDPLTQLRDIHLPEAISAWPPAPGWWVLAALIIICMTGAVLWWRHYRRKNAWRREAIAQLDTIDASAATPAELQAFNTLLRRSLISAGDSGAANLSGSRWVAHLQSAGLEVPHASLLDDAPYRDALTDEQSRLTPELIANGKHFLRRYKVTEKPA